MIHKKTIIFISILFLGLFGWARNSEAATYYVDKDSIGGACNDTNAGVNITAPWCTINKANKTLVAGDIVYIRAGTYNIGNEIIDGGSVNSQGIRPGNSGSAGARITYSAYPGEIINFVGVANGSATRADAVVLDGKSYIHITGVSGYNMTFTNMCTNLKIGYNGNSGSYNEIDHVDFGTFNPNCLDINYRGTTIMNGSTYNYIHDNKIHDWQWYTTDNDGPVCMEIGKEMINGDDGTYYNVIENNQFYHCGHHVVGLQGKYTVFRGNVVHNENYINYDGKLYGYRNLLVNGPGYNLIESNRIGPSGISRLSEAAQQRGGTSFYLNSSYNIARYNAIFGALGMALNFRSYDGYPVSYNSVYNNTFYSNGYSTENDINCYERFPTHFSDNSATLETGNKVKNNLYHYNWPQTPLGTIISSGQAGQTGCGTKTITPVINDESSGGALARQTITNNLELTYTAAPFVNADLSNPMSTTLPDLSLVPGSSAIDAASYLTQANGAGSNSTTLIVGDARYFQDGNFGQGALVWPSSVAMRADWIAIGTITNVAQISSINYTTNTITLVSPMTWTNNASIWLYKKSDGVQVLYGTASDMGAYEYIGFGADTTSPGAPSGLAVQ